MQSANRRELKIVHKTKNSNTHNPSKFYLDSNSKIKAKQITIIFLILRMEKKKCICQCRKLQFSNYTKTTAKN